MRIGSGWTHSHDDAFLGNWSAKNLNNSALLRLQLGYCARWPSVKCASTDPRAQLRRNKICCFILLVVRLFLVNVVRPLASENRWCAPHTGNMGFNIKVSLELPMRCVVRSAPQRTRYSGSLGTALKPHLFKKSARLLHLNDDKAQLTARDKSEVTCTLTLHTGDAGISWHLSCSPSWLPIQTEVMYVARSAPHWAHNHADVI